MKAPFVENLDGPAVDRYLDRTAGSRALGTQARRVMPGGSTRAYGFFKPYPLVFERGSGPYLWDVDGRRYVDFTCNGLSLIHGHAFAPVEEALFEAIPQGTAWVGPSRSQISYAELLCERIPTAERVRFTNTGTEATMLATKLARRATGRPLILKSYGAYHGSYDDLEAGLYGIGDLPGRTVVAQFGDLDSYERVFAQNEGQIAAVIIEPVLLTFRVAPPPEGFLPALVELARKHEALVIVDDCLMFRLAYAGSAQKYGFEPDLTCLGKFIGGGVPMGVVAGPSELLSLLDSRRENSVYHGGSFNGNPLASSAGKVALEHLTAERIDQMDVRAERLRQELREGSQTAGLPLQVTGEGSVLGSYVLDPDGEPDREVGAYLHLAAIDRGVFFGPDGEMALSTAFDDEALEFTVEAMAGAFAETAEWAAKRS